jgi:transketolase C-terminal domain/subunit
MTSARYQDYYDELLTVTETGNKEPTDERSMRDVPIVTRPHVENFIRWSADKPEVVVLSADLTNSCEVGKWRDTYPERFFSMGMAEQNMLGFAGGLAREGFEPWLHTFAVFLYRRPLDQLQMSIAYPNLQSAAGRLPARHHHSRWRDPPSHRRHRRHARDPEHDDPGNG